MYLLPMPKSDAPPAPTTPVSDRESFIAGAASIGYLATLFGLGASGHHALAIAASVVAPVTLAASMDCYKSLNIKSTLAGAFTAVAVFGACSSLENTAGSSSFLSLPIKSAYNNP